MVALLGKSSFERRKRYLFCAGLCRAVAERCVGQTKSKRKLRCILLVDITREKFLLALLRRMCRISFGPSSVLRIVVKRLLAHGTRPAERQMPGRRSIAKKNICRRVTRLHAGEPRSNHCGNVFQCPRKSKRTSTKQTPHYRLYGRHNSSKQR